MAKSPNQHKLVTLFFAPQISSTYWFLLLYAKGNSTPISLMLAIVFSSLVQICSLVLYARISKSGLEVADRKKRLPLFAVSVASYLIGFILLELVGAQFIFKALMLAYVVNTIAAALVTKYLTKVSVHVWGISGPSVAILYAYGHLVLMLMLLLALVVGYSRMKAKAHTSGQVVLAVLLSLLLTAFVIYGLGMFI